MRLDNYLLLPDPILLLGFDRESLRGSGFKISPSHAQAVRELKIKEIADGIYVLESSGGQNDGCQFRGKFNGYGFAQNKIQFVCYSTQQEVRQKVENWIKEKQGKGFTEAQTLCYYNTGKILNTCPYYKNYLKLK